MRRRPELLAVALALLAPADARADGWRLVFADDFSGASLDRTRWATRYIYNFEQSDKLGDEVELYRDSGNHVVQDGILALIARPKAGLRPPARFESGMIRSRQTFYYGYFEARVFLPDARGSFPAFWLNSDYDRDGGTRWPPEIDAFEFVMNANETPDMIHSSVHTTKGKPQGGELLYRNPRFTADHNFYRAAAPLNRGWQTIGLLWKPDSVTSYLNGEKLWTRTYRWVDRTGRLAPPAHVLLNLAVGGNWAGEGGVDAARFPQQFRVDYVRVCQFSAARDAGSTCGGSKFTPGLAESRYRGPSDMPRSSLSYANVVRAADGRYVLRMGVRGTPTGNDHLVNLVATDARGRATLAARLRPSVPTSTWRGQLDMTGRFCLPRGLAAGDYRLWLGIGSPDGKGDWKNIPLVAGPEYGIRSGHRRYQIGSISVAKDEGRTAGPCQREK